MIFLIYWHLKFIVFQQTDCINWNQYFNSCKPKGSNPYHGAISFDNIGLAWVAIFLVSETAPFPTCEILI